MTLDEAVAKAKDAGAKVTREVRGKYHPVIAVEFLPGDFLAFARQVEAEALEKSLTACSVAIRALSPPAGRKDKHAPDCGVGTFKCTCGAERP